VTGTSGAHRLLLASASPRRRELLALLDRAFEVVATEVDETPRPGEPPESLVERLALAKAGAGWRIADASLGSDVAIGADTVVVVDGEVVGKPIDEADAAAVLRRLSGRTHEVLTGLAVVADGMARSTVVATTVTFVPLSEAAIAAYVATGEPADKAGAYGIQGRGGRFVAAIDGSYHNVVGLPLAQLADLLDELDEALAGDGAISGDA
jgi:septum formation protein